ncbi:Csu type fimbrial protein [Halomonas halocynthiae]|uniref:Csu type fimbrial protein n=1 Tax=Halomonas halocynthiae TaxID=176290 RepID=UPI000555E1D8|nr:spore coat U domain-containing protein [Halomonas halocynthiae]
MNWPRCVLLVAVLGLFPAGRLLAQPQDSFVVSATIEGGCLVDGSSPANDASLGSLGNLDFGTHSSLSQATVDTTLLTSGSVTLSCTPGIALSMRINGGLHPVASARRLRDVVSGDTLVYQLFTDASALQPVFIDVPVSVDTSTDPDDIQLPVHGRISLPGDVSPGLYQDTLTVTLEW